MKTLFVASDLSARSDRAVQRAFMLARDAGARLVALCVIDEDLPADLAESRRREAAARLQRLCDGLAGAGDGAPVDFEARAEIGDPLRDIHRTVERIDADLAVFGLHRLRPWRDLFGATTMERLVRMSVKPVLVVRDPADHPYATALAGVDLSPASAAALRAVRRIAPAARLVSFYAFHIPFKGFMGGAPSSAEMKPYLDEAHAELEAWRRNAALPEGMAPPQLVQASVQQALMRFMESEKPDLLAVGAHGRATISPSLLGSFTESLMRDPPCDLLIVRR